MTTSTVTTTTISCNAPHCQRYIATNADIPDATSNWIVEAAGWRVEVGEETKHWCEQHRGPAMGETKNEPEGRT